MDKYKILFDLTQQGWRMGKQQMSSSILTRRDNKNIATASIVLLWGSNTFISHKGVLRRFPEAHDLIKYIYGFTEQKLPNEK